MSRRNHSCVVSCRRCSFPTGQRQTHAASILFLRQPCLLPPSNGNHGYTKQPELQAPQESQPPSPHHDWIGRLSVLPNESRQSNTGHKMEIPSSFLIKHSHWGQASIIFFGLPMYKPILFQTKWAVCCFPPARPSDPAGLLAASTASPGGWKVG